jgi:hypothetical protein
MESRIYHISHTDLVSCDGWLNWIINGRRGRQCESRPVVGSVVFQCMNNIPKNDYKAVFSKKIVRLKMCVDTNGGYFEGLSQSISISQYLVVLKEPILKTFQIQLVFVLGVSHFSQFAFSIVFWNYSNNSVIFFVFNFIADTLTQVSRYYIAIKNIKHLILIRLHVILYHMSSFYRFSNF